MRSFSRRTSAASRPRAGGFTAVELVTATALLLLVAGGILSVFLTVQRSEVFVSDRAQALDDMRIAMSTLSKDIRQAEAVAETSTASRLEITTFVGGARATVVYEAAGDTVTRAQDGGTAVIILRRLVNTSVFTYTPSVADAKIVTVSLEVEPQADPDTIVQLSGEIRLRNAQKAVS